MTGRRTILHMSFRFLCTIILTVFTLVGSGQKTSVKQFKIKDNLMFITLSRSVSIKEVDEFTAKYNISGIGLHQLIGSGKSDSIQLMGWKIDESNPDLYTISKPLQSYGKLSNLPKDIIFTPVPTPDDWR